MQLKGRIRRLQPLQIDLPGGELYTMEERRVGDEYLNWIEFQKRGLPLNDH